MENDSNKKEDVISCPNEASSEEEILSYWTEERKRSAKPLPMPPDTDQRGTRAGVEEENPAP